MYTNTSLDYLCERLPQVSENSTMDGHYEALKYATDPKNLTWQTIDDEDEHVFHFFDTGEKNYTASYKAFADYIQHINRKLFNNSPNSEEKSDFRTATAFVTDSQLPRTDPQRIEKEILEAISNYRFQKDAWREKKIRNNNELTEELEYELFRIEAQLHCTLLKIHPFPDGNGRTFRIVTSVDLLNEGIVPPLLNKEDKAEYNDYIEYQNINGMADFLFKISKRERDLLEAEETKKR